MKHPLHFPKCSRTQPTCEIKKAVTRAHIFLYVHAGDLASTMASLHGQSRGNHLPICCASCDYGSIMHYRHPRSPVYPASSSACTPPVPARSARAGKEIPLLTSAQAYSVCLPFRLATLSFAPGLLLGKGIPHKASATSWHRQGSGAFSCPPRVKQLRKLIQDHH